MTEQNLRVDFRHDERLNHIYNNPQRSGELKDYFRGVDGEFAIGFVDGNNAILARDWAGSVPFHYLITPEGGIVTANTIRDLMAHPEYDWGRVRAVKAGHVVYIPSHGRFTEKNIQEVRYKPSLADLPLVQVSPEEAGRYIREKLIEETEKRLKFVDGKRIALALSGGIDSFSVALAARELGSSSDIEFFCINTEGQGKDWPNAQKAADYLQVNLNELRAGKQDTIEAVPKAIWLSELYKDYDVFCAVTCCLFGEELRRRGIDVVFTGDGANEVFRDYTNWGCYQTDPQKMIQPEMGTRLIEGREGGDPFISPQLGGGYAKSSARGSKVFAGFDVDCFNPFLAEAVAGYIAKLDLRSFAKWDQQGNPLWKKKIMQAAFPEVPQELFPLKTRMQDGVGTTDVICSVRRSDLQKNGTKGGFAKYGRGALDDDFQIQNPDYYTDLFRKYHREMFIGKQSIDEAERRWNEMLADLELDKPDGFGWVLAEGSMGGEEA